MSHKCPNKTKVSLTGKKYTIRCMYLCDTVICSICGKSFCGLELSGWPENEKVLVVGHDPKCGAVTNCKVHVYPLGTHISFSHQ